MSAKYAPFETKTAFSVSFTAKSLPFYDIPKKFHQNFGEEKRISRNVEKYEVFAKKRCRGLEK